MRGPRSSRVRQGFPHTRSAVSTSAQLGAIGPALRPPAQTTTPAAIVVPSSVLLGYPVRSFGSPVRFFGIPANPPENAPSPSHLFGNIARIRGASVQSRSRFSGTLPTASWRPRTTLSDFTPISPPKTATAHTGRFSPARHRIFAGPATDADPATILTTSMPKSGDEPVSMVRKPPISAHGEEFEEPTRHRACIHGQLGPKERIYGVEEPPLSPPSPSSGSEGPDSGRLAAASSGAV